jgi:death on curing protein
VKEPIWIEELDALALHGRLLALYGGAGGVRAHGLLQSALARPRQLRAYGHDPDIFELAAAYAVGIVRNHPFTDGNKRVGFLIGVLFLEINGYRFNAPEEDATQAVMALASNTMDEASFAAWMRTNSRRQPRPVKRKRSAPSTIVR